MSGVLVTDLRFGFAGKGADNLLLFDRFSIAFPAAALTAVMGPSGCGKTTLLNLIAGIHSPLSGTIQRNASQIRHVGYVFQQPTLIPWQTVMQNALFGAEVAGVLNARVRGRAEALLAAYNLAEYTHAFPQQLSGGMQQRLAIVRAVVAGGDLILLDEPFSSSDVQIRRGLHEDLSSLVTTERLTAILVTHDIHEALSLADHVLVLRGKPAQAVRCISVPIPRTERFAASGRLRSELSLIYDNIWHALTSEDDLSA